MTPPPNINISGYHPYRPYSKEQWAKIEKLWKIYRDDIGLEGELCSQLVKEHKSDDEIKEAIEMHRKDVEGNLEAWNQLKGEIKR
jgi:hypothetical protein